MEGLIAGVTAVPVRETVPVVFHGSFEPKVRDPVLIPAVVGLKVTCRVVLAPGSREVTAGPVKLKEDPEIWKELRESVLEEVRLEFKIVIVVALVSPAGMMPKSWVVGEICRSGAMPVPFRERRRVSASGSSLMIVKIPVTASRTVGVKVTDRVWDESGAILKLVGETEKGAEAETDPSKVSSPSFEITSGRDPLALT